MDKNGDQPAKLGTIGENLEKNGVSRRKFMEFCGGLMVAAPFGLQLTNKLVLNAVAGEVASAPRPPVIWLHFQDCTGCSETLLRTSKPDLGELITSLISLEYHETVMSAAGHQAEKTLEDAVKANSGGFVLVVEGSIPTKDGGIYCQIGGRTALDMLKETASHAAAIVAIGSCATWGGIPSSGMNPTGAEGVGDIIKDKPIVNLPGCPPNAYNLMGVVLEFAKYGSLPKLDDEGRPLFAYDRLIHDHCPRRAHFDAGEFVQSFGDEGHRKGWCLYKMGCKGPDTIAGCSVRHFNELPGVWPIGIGAPCYGCTEKHIAFKQGLFELAAVHGVTPPTTYPEVHAEEGEVSPLATGLVGLATGAVAGAAYAASRYYSPKSGDNSVPADPGDPSKEESE